MLCHKIATSNFMGANCQVLLLDQYVLLISNIFFVSVVLYLQFSQSHHLTFHILFSNFIYYYGIAYSVRRVGFHLYNPLSTSQSTSIRVFLNTASFFASLPVVSGVSSTLAHKIIYRVMASVRSDYTAHVIFKVQKSFFEYPFTYYSLETPKCCSLQKNPLTNKA